MPAQQSLEAQAAQLLVATNDMQTYERSVGLLWDFIECAVASVAWLAVPGHDPATARVTCCAAWAPRLIGCLPFACISAYVAMANAA